MYFNARVIAYKNNWIEVRLIDKIDYSDVRNMIDHSNVRIIVLKYRLIDVRAYWLSLVFELIAGERWYCASVVQRMRVLVPILPISYRNKGCSTREWQVTVSLSLSQMPRFASWQYSIARRTFSFNKKIKKINAQYTFIKLSMMTLPLKSNTKLN